MRLVTLGADRLLGVAKNPEKSSAKTLESLRSWLQKSQLEIQDPDQLGAQALLLQRCGEARSFESGYFLSGV